MVCGYDGAVASRRCRADAGCAAARERLALQSPRESHRSARWHAVEERRLGRAVLAHTTTHVLVLGLQCLLVSDVPRDSRDAHRARLLADLRAEDDRVAVALPDRAAGA